MKSLVLLVVLVAVGIAGFAYYRGWFAVSTSGGGPAPSATVTVDKTKIHDDEQKAKDDVQAFGRDAKKKIGDLGGKANEPQRVP